MFGCYWTIPGFWSARDTTHFRQRSTQQNRWFISTSPLSSMIASWHNQVCSTTDLDLASLAFECVYLQACYAFLKGSSVSMIQLTVEPIEKNDYYSPVDRYFIWTITGGCCSTIFMFLWAMSEVWLMIITFYTLCLQHSQVTYTCMLTVHVYCILYTAGIKQVFSFIEFTITQCMILTLPAKNYWEAFPTDHVFPWFPMAMEPCLPMASPQLPGCIALRWNCRCGPHAKTYLPQLVERDPHCGGSEVGSGGSARDPNIGY